MKLIISGSRRMTSYKEFKENVERILEERVISVPSRVVVGCNPKGADNYADRWARENEVDFLRLAAKWTRDGDKAGPFRNTRLAESIRSEDIVVTFIGPESKGTRDFVAKAIKLTFASNMHIIDVNE